jgi:DNA-binding transcriptional regulator YdaS (Cro superfamily)
MDMRTYYDSLPVGGRRALADALEIAPAYLYQMASGRRTVSPKLCRSIERATNGVVTVHDLRPDVFGEAPDATAGAVPAEAVETATHRRLAWPC